MRHRRLLSGSLLMATVALTACGGDDDDSAAVTTTVAAESASTDASSGVTTVDANTASVDEIAAALSANGVSNAERWAREVEEYRPYDVSDSDLGKLRDELAKYKPDSDTLEAIIASLTV